VLSEGLCQIIPSGFKPVSFQFVAQCLNQLHCRVPQQCEIKIHFNEVHSLVSIYILQFNAWVWITLNLLGSLNVHEYGNWKNVRRENASMI